MTQPTTDQELIETLRSLALQLKISGVVDLKQARSDGIKFMLNMKQQSPAQSIFTSAVILESMLSAASEIVSTEDSSLEIIDKN